MQPRALRTGEIVVLVSTEDRPLVAFENCLMVVTDTDADGAFGYVKNCGDDELIWYRATWLEMAPTGGMVTPLRSMADPA